MQSVRSTWSAVLGAVLVARALAGCMGYVEPSADAPPRTTDDGAVRAKVDFGTERPKVSAMQKLGAFRSVVDASHDVPEEAEGVKFAEIELILAESCAGCHRTGGATPDF